MPDKQRAYVAHRWMATDAGSLCFVCGMTEATWKRRTRNASLLDNDCFATRERKGK